MHVSSSSSTDYDLNGIQSQRFNRLNGPDTVSTMNLQRFNNVKNKRFELHSLKKSSSNLQYANFGWRGPLSCWAAEKPIAGNHSPYFTPSKLSSTHAFRPIFPNIVKQREIRNGHSRVTAYA